MLATIAVGSVAGILGIFCLIIAIQTASSETHVIVTVIGSTCVAVAAATVLAPSESVMSTVLTDRMGVGFFVASYVGLSACFWGDLEIELGFSRPTPDTQTDNRTGDD
jgi:hypothetical protein